MNELLDLLEKLIERLAKTFERVDIENKEARAKELNSLMNDPDFWNDQKKASRISKEAADLVEETNDWEEILQKAEDLYKLAKELDEAKDYSMKRDIEDQYKELEDKFMRMEAVALLSGEYDRENAVVSIFAGAGGTDAQDWTEMVLKMYLRYAEKKNWKIEIFDKSEGQEAGIKSITFEVKGKNAYGFMKAENGVHRLVRISPFDAEKMRHTSFAMVQVLPELEEVEIEIHDDDLEITTAKASGPGGQGVNTTDSAVRMKHKPTGIVVTCKNERSQLQNKESALKVLKSKIHQYHQAEQEEEKKKLRGEFTEAAWGNQVRSYVLHPYKMVKDHRSGYETQDPDKILDGELDEVIEAYLRVSLKTTNEQ